MPLKQLNLIGCKKITDAGLEHLNDMSLEQLSLYDCPGITKEVVQNFEDQNPNVKVITTRPGT
jgi:hypothetical protein